MSVAVRRLGVTAGFVAVACAGRLLSIPGVDLPMSGMNDLFGDVRLDPFMLGATPFISAFLLTELGLLAFFRARRTTDGALRATAWKVAMALSFVLAAVQGFGIAVSLEQMLYDPGLRVRMLVLAGVLLGHAALFVGTLFVDRRGLGSGLGALVLLQAAEAAWGFLGSAFDMARMGIVRPITLLLLALALGGLVWGVVWSFRNRWNPGPGLRFRQPVTGLWPLGAAGVIWLVPTELSLEAQIALGALVVAAWSPIAATLFHWQQRAQVKGQPSWGRAIAACAVVLGLGFGLDVVLGEHVADWLGVATVLVGTALVLDLSTEFRAWQRPGTALLGEAADVHTGLDAQLRHGPGTVVPLAYRSLTRIFGVAVPIRVLGAKENAS